MDQNEREVDDRTRELRFVVKRVDQLSGRCKGLQGVNAVRVSVGVELPSPFFVGVNRPIFEREFICREIRRTCEREIRRRTS